MLTPATAVTIYRWGSMTGADYFCAICGILPFRKPGHPTAAEQIEGVTRFEGWAVNTRCLEGFDPASVPVRAIHGLTL